MTDLALFREETRDWLETNCPPEMKKPMTPHGMTWGGRNCKFSHPDQELWLKRLGEKGWTAPTWPKEYGGGGLSFEENQVLQSELARINARPALVSFGISMLGPVLLEYGTEKQKQEHIPKTDIELFDQINKDVYRTRREETEFFARHFDNAENYGVADFHFQLNDFSIPSDNFELLKTFFRTLSR